MCLHQRLLRSIDNWFSKEKSSVPVKTNNCYESDILKSNIFSATATCGLCLSNMVGKQNTEVQPNITQQEIIEKHWLSHMLQWSHIFLYETRTHRSLENYSNWNYISVLQPPGVRGWNSEHIKPSPKAKRCNEFYYCTGNESWIERRYEQL